MLEVLVGFIIGFVTAIWCGFADQGDKELDLDTYYRNAGLPEEED